MLVWLTARRLWSPAAGWRAAAVLSGMLMFVVLGQLLTLDMSLTFYMTLSLAAFLLAQTAARPRPGCCWRGRPRPAACLTKGLVAAAIPAAVLILYSGYSRDFGPWRRLHLKWGLLLFLAITVPWHWLAARRLPDFPGVFLRARACGAVLDPDRRSAGSLVVLRPGVSGGQCAVDAAGAARVGTGWRRRAPPGAFNPTLFLWIWMVFIGVFFSLSDSKLMPYILPVMPALGAADRGTAR